MPEQGRIKLIDGPEIELGWLLQRRTYEGLLVGLPTRQMNVRMLREVVAKERKRIGEQPHLIVPTEVPIPYERELEYGKPARLPAIMCVGDFLSEPARDRADAFSSLSVIWFQEGYAFPIAAEALNAIRQIDWYALAHHGSF